MSGLGQGLSQVGQAGFNDALMSRRMEAIEQMRQKREDQVYQRNRADSQWDLTEQRTYNDWQAEDERVRAAEAAKASNQEKRDYYKWQKEKDQEYAAPTYKEGADGNLYAVQGNKANPVQRPMTDDEAAVANTNAPEMQPDEVHDLLSKGIIEGQMKNRTVPLQAKTTLPPSGMTLGNINQSISNILREIQSIESDARRSRSPEGQQRLIELKGDLGMWTNERNKRAGFGVEDSSESLTDEQMRAVMERFN